MVDGVEIINRSLADISMSYKTIESLLVELYELEGFAASKLRARYKNFQKLGLPDRRPGTGSKAGYSLHEFCEILVAMELSEFGLDPSIVVLMSLDICFDTTKTHPISAIYVLMEEIFRESDKNNADRESVFLAYFPSAMSARWRSVESQATHFPVSDEHIIVRLEYLREIIDTYSYSGRTSLINLSRLAARAHRVLVKGVLGYGDY